MTFEEHRDGVEHAKNLGIHMGHAEFMLIDWYQERIRVRDVLDDLLRYTQSCEDLLNSSEGGAVKEARKLLQEIDRCG